MKATGLFVIGREVTYQCLSNETLAELAATQ